MNYRCLVVDKSPTGDIRCAPGIREVPVLATGHCLVQLEYSAINYKDCLAAAGHPGVAKSLPLVPGIDAVGEIVQSHSPQWQVGQPVIISHADFGTAHDGGFAEYAAVPGDWLVPLPAGMSAFEAAAVGTAGYTAAQCCQALLAHGITPSSGPIVVSGATGGVGIFAVKLLRNLGFHVVASSGKPDRRDWLISHGAHEVVRREALHDESARPLLSAKWGGAVDTVGGLCLSTILRQTRPRGCVAACGLVGGAELPITVYPFILRGVVLAGIDSAGVTNAERRLLWQRMASEWKFAGLTDITRRIGLPELPTELENIRAGQVAGRVVVDLQA